MVPVFVSSSLAHTGREVDRYAEALDAGPVADVLDGPRRMRASRGCCECGAAPFVSFDEDGVSPV